MPAPTKVQLIGGPFEDAEGNVLNLGYLEMKLSQDESIAGVGQIASGITIRIQLNSSGSVDTSTPQSVWGNDQMLPVNSYYRVTGFTQAGQRAWGPNNQQVIGNGGTFDVGTWVPNIVLSWFPPLQPLQLEVNGVNNASQSLLDFVNSPTVVWTDQGSGKVSAAAVTAGVLDLKTNGVDNANQAILNLKSTDSSLTLTSSGDGSVNMVVTKTIPDPATTVSYSTPSWINTSTPFESPANSINNANGGLGNPVYSFVAPTVSTPGYELGTTAGTAGFSTYWDSSSVRLIPQQVKQLRMKIGISDTTAIRVWLGMTDAIGTTPGLGVFSTDDPTQVLLGFRYSSVAGDTHWQAVANAVSGAQTLVDTGVAPDGTGAIHTFDVRFAQGVPGTALFFIDNVQVATISTNMPSPSTSLGWLAFTQQTGAAARAMGWNLVSVTYFQ